MMAAVLACGPGAVLSHRAAADLHGLRPGSATRIDVTIPGRDRRRRGIAIHRSRTLLERDRTTVDGIPCTSVARTLLDLAEVVDPGSLEKAIERAEILRVFDLAAVQDVLARANGRSGAARLRAAIAAIATKPPTRNELEQAMFDIWTAARMPRPEVNWWIPLTSGPGYEPDFGWPDLRLIAETDGFETHGTRTAFEQDRRRDQQLAVQGWRVVRFTWRQVIYEPKTVRRTLTALSEANPRPAISAPPR